MKFSNKPVEGKAPTKNDLKKEQTKRKVYNNKHKTAPSTLTQRDGGVENVKGQPINNAFFNKAMGGKTDASDFTPAPGGLAGASGASDGGASASAGGDAGGACGESLKDTFARLDTLDEGAQYGDYFDSDEDYLEYIKIQLAQAKEKLEKDFGMSDTVRSVYEQRVENLTNQINKLENKEEIPETVENAELTESTIDGQEDLFFKAYVTNLGKYNEGELIGDYVEFPIDEDAFTEFLHSIGVSDEPTEDGEYYEEWFVTDYDTNTNISLGEYPSYEELNEVGEMVNQINQNHLQDVYSNAMEVCDGTPIEIGEAVIDGDIIFYDGVTTDSDLGYAIIDSIGSLGDALGDRVTSYIDKDEMKREYEDDCRNILWGEAKYQIASEQDITEDEVSESDIEEYVDENLDNYVESVVDEEIAMAEKGEVDLSDFFDYEMFGRDCHIEGMYMFTNEGCIEDRR